MGSTSRSAEGPTTVSVKVPDAAAAANVLGVIARANIVLENFSLGTPSLDDVFFTLTGKPPAPPPGDAAEKVGCSTGPRFKAHSGSAPTRG